MSLRAIAIICVLLIVCGDCAFSESLTKGKDAGNRQGMNDDARRAAANKAPAGAPLFSDDVMAPWEGGAAYYARWPNGPSTDPKFFPIAVWLQQPFNADSFRELGFNTYVGLWEGPTAEQLRQLSERTVPVFCSQNSVGLGRTDTAVIKGWMHLDEPDNAQPDGKGGYGPPISARTVIDGYKKMRAADRTRPVLLNLGQGVAWDGWYGRGVRTNHPEDYAEYARGADILSFDIYPVNMKDAPVNEKLWLVARGVDRLRKWGNYKKPVWNWIECTDFNGSGRKPTPVEVKAEVWMSIIHGTRGIGYFVHVFAPSFIEAGLLSDAEMSAAVRAINRQIAALAPVLNRPSVANGVTVSSGNAAVPVDVMLKRFNGETYLFAVAMRPGRTTATFRFRGFPKNATAEVLGERRARPVSGGIMTDTFTDYGVHLYRVSFR